MGCSRFQKETAAADPDASSAENVGNADLRGGGAG
jgi:hypothetical protein